MKKATKIAVGILLVGCAVAVVIKSKYNDAEKGKHVVIIGPSDEGKGNPYPQPEACHNSESEETLEDTTQP